MDELKRKIKKRRRISGIASIITAILLAVSIALIILLVDKYLVFTILFVIFSAMAFMLAIVCYIMFCCLNFKEYNYNGIKISVYAGGSHHYLYVNEKLMDEYTCSVTLTPLHLKANYLGNDIMVEIALDNSINVRVNDEFVREEKNKK